MSLLGSSAIQGLGLLRRYGRQLLHDLRDHLDLRLGSPSRMPSPGAGLKKFQVYLNSSVGQKKDSEIKFIDFCSWFRLRSRCLKVIICSN